MKWFFCLVTIVSYNCGFSQKGLVDSVKMGSIYENRAQLAEILRKEGIRYKNNGDYNVAEEFYQASLEESMAIGDSIGIATALNSFGLFYSKKGENSKALKLFYRAIDINKKINYQRGLVFNYLNLGNFFYYQNNFGQSLEFYYLCREQLVNKNDQSTLASIHIGIGNILSDADYSNNNLQKARNEYLSALVIYNQLTDTLNISKVYVNLGVIASSQKKYDEAIEYYLKGLRIKQTRNDHKGIIIACLNIGNALQEKKDYTQSLEYYNRGKKIAQEISDGENYFHILSNLVNVYMELGKADSAAILFEEYDALQDSIYDEEKSRQLSELQTQYETEKTSEELRQQKSATEEKEAQNRILTIVVILLTALAVAVVVLYIQRQKAVRHLRDREEELHKKELSRVQKEQDIQSLQSMMEGQQQERKRIAEDLHDRLGAKLSAIKLFHESSHSDTNKFDKVDEMLNETIIETREIAHNLAPSVLTKYGLVQALQDLLDTIHSTNKIKAQFSHTNLEQRLPEAIETALYYIVQELVTNTLRHGEAELLSINLVYHDDGTLNLCYEDNGKGFDPASLPKDSMGLRNMRTRLAPFSGKLSIDSTPDHGVTFIIDISLSQLSIS